MGVPSGEIIARPMVARACGCLCEFQHYAVDKYRAQRLAKFQKTRCPECVAKLVEHNTNATQFLSGLIKGASEAHLPAPELLKTLEQSKRDLAAAIKALRGGCLHRGELPLFGQQTTGRRRIKKRLQTGVNA